MKIKISRRKTINTLLKSTANCIKDETGEYYFLPFWFEKAKDGNFIMHHLEKLSNDMKGKIIKNRNSKN